MGKGEGDQSRKVIGMATAEMTRWPMRVGRRQGMERILAQMKRAGDYIMSKNQIYEASVKIMENTTPTGNNVNYSPHVIAMPREEMEL